MTQSLTNIVADSVVTLEITLLNVDGEIIEEGGDPTVYLHGGYGDIFDKVEQTLESKTVGFEESITLTPDEAFGEFDEQLIFLEDAKALPEGVTVGMALEADIAGSGETRILMITEIADGKAVLDGNHPLAGMTVTLQVKVLAIRKATDGEKEHGHAHGEDGSDNHHDHEDDDHFRTIH